MNGVISTSMRQKGMNYKLIFGVPIPEIKHIAAAHEPDAELARALWKEDVREMKILATLLFPAGSMTQEEALTGCVKFLIRRLPNNVAIIFSPR